MMLAYLPISHKIIIHNRHRTQWCTNMSSSTKILYNFPATYFPQCPRLSSATPLPLRNLFPSVCTFPEFYWAGSGLFCIEHYALWKAYRTVLYLLLSRTSHYFLNTTEISVWSSVVWIFLSYLTITQAMRHLCKLTAWTGGCNINRGKHLIVTGLHQIQHDI